MCICVFDVFLQRHQQKKNPLNAEKVTAVKWIGRSTHTADLHMQCGKDWPGGLLSTVTHREGLKHCHYSPSHISLPIVLELLSLLSSSFSCSHRLSARSSLEADRTPNVSAFLQRGKPTANLRRSTEIRTRKVKLRASLNTNLSQQHQQLWLEGVTCVCVWVCVCMCFCCVMQVGENG